MGYTCDFFAIRKEELDTTDFSPFRDHEAVLNNTSLTKQPHNLLATNYWKAYTKYWDDDPNMVEIPYKRLTFPILHIFEDLFDIDDTIDTQSHHFILNAWEMELFISSVLNYIAENDADNFYDYQVQELKRYLTLVKEEKDKRYYIYGWD